MRYYYLRILTKVRIFLIPLSITFSNPKTLVSLAREMRKIKLKKILGNLLDKLRKLYMNRTFI